MAIHSTYFLDEWVFNLDYANDLLKKQFETSSLKGFGIDDLNNGIISSSAIMHYLNETQHERLNHITSIKRIPKRRTCLS